MSSWMPARPMALLEADLKKLGFKDKEIKKLLATKDKNALRAVATEEIQKNAAKAKDMKAALNKVVPGLF